MADKIDERLNGFKQEIHSIRTLLDEKIISPKEHSRLRVKAVKKLNGEITWNRSLDADLKKMF